MPGGHKIGHLTIWPLGVLARSRRVTITGPDGRRGMRPCPTRATARPTGEEPLHTCLRVAGSAHSVIGVCNIRYPRYPFGTTERRWSDCTNHVEVAVARGAPSTRSRSSEGDQRAPGKTTAATVRPRSGTRTPSGAVPICGHLRHPPGGFWRSTWRECSLNASFSLGHPLATCVASAQYSFRRDGVERRTLRRTSPRLEPSGDRRGKLTLAPGVGASAPAPRTSRNDRTRDSRQGVPGSFNARFRGPCDAATRPCPPPPHCALRSAGTPRWLS